MRHRRRTHRVLLATVATLALAPLAVSPGAAAPAYPDSLGAPASPETPATRITGSRALGGRAVELAVYSAAMGREIPVRVLPAVDPAATAPVLYLLNGITGGSEGGNWFDRTDLTEFFGSEQVTVVNPIGGAGSWFTDWQADDPVLGRQRWTTFLTTELPPLIDATYRGSGADALAGVSMAAASVFQLALAAPGRYRALGSYSGCVRTSDPQGRALVELVVRSNGGNPVNMWGPPQDPAWPDNDPFLHAEQLRGTVLYISSGTGTPGALDTMDGPGIRRDPGKLLDQLLIGGLLETVTARCTARLGEHLADLGIPATVALRPDGTHSWGYWQRELHDSWPLFAAALNG
ncbi:MULTISPECIES: alpha/beta hydrolase [Nocardia]|uniref:alpha/beta hydrolase n=1 Tax=Nocardia TaxID=1817 RepID=UPI001895F9D7|nr:MULTISPECIES: alpha/beta hydrolase family protein [Nocardia]MBF6347999.1 esterase family protein [Nocardia flavorosea]